MPTGAREVLFVSIDMYTAFKDKSFSLNFMSHVFSPLLLY